MPSTQEKDPETGQGFEVCNPSKGITSVNTTISPADSLATIRERFEAITQEQEHLESERRRVLIRTRDEWRAGGIDAHIVTQPHRGRKLERKNLVSMFEIINDIYRRGEWKRDVTYIKLYEGVEGVETEEKWGPYASATGDCFWLHRGSYVCVLADDQYAVIAAAAKFYPASGAQVARAGARLRSLARREYMRVSIRDTAVTITSPMNDIVHEGDIFSAYLWLHGLEEHAIEDRIRDRVQENPDGKPLRRDAGVTVELMERDQ